MEKTRTIFLVASALVLALPILPAPPPVDMAVLFPDLDGWTRDGGTEMFLPDNLFEHINGAAENFLAYGFERLAVQNYVGSAKQAIGAEIYFHGSAENAFGIYSSEKPLAGDYFAIGSEGYAEEGVLNFISDAYYVKLNGFDLGAQGGPLLKALAAKIAAAIGGDHSLPGLIGAFPAAGRIAHSERYFPGNFLGHDFLLPTFTADYDLDGEKFQIFIIKADSEEAARAMLSRYATLDKGVPGREIRPGQMTINDPYNGPIQLSWRGAYIWGLSGTTGAGAKYLEAIGGNLE